MIELLVACTSPALLALHPEVCPFASVLPSCPAGVNQILLNHEISDAKCSRDPCLQEPFYPASSSEICCKAKPEQSKGGPRYTAYIDLFRGVVAQVDATHRNSSSTSHCNYREHETTSKAKRCVRFRRVWNVPKEEEQHQRDGEEGDKLGMRGRHAVAFAVHFYSCVRIESEICGGEYLTSWTFFLDIALEHPIESLTSHLAREHQKNLNLTI